ncbi:PaaI family thioesterase [Metabacillus herbersteinensis]|uniref:PaaI family thioesterase n=1 Tax=Metabacillus herbersteinensis TaxID=283816 RepID=A0ABV6GLS3_9BACI
MNKVVDEIRESFEASPFFSHVGFEIVRFDEGDILLKLGVRPPLLNVNETLHGGVHATMLDFILGMVIRSSTRTRCVTMNLNINYLAPTIAGEIFAKGKILQQGYRTVTAEGELFDPEENLLAKGVGTFKLIRDY